MLVKQPPRPNKRKKDPVVSDVLPEVAQTPAPKPSKKRIRSVANIKAEQRYKEKKLAERNAKKGAETFREFWAASLKGGNQQKIVEWKARQERVFDLMWYIEQHANGNYTNPASPYYCDPKHSECFVSVEEGDADLREDIAQHGTCSRVILEMGRFWKNPARLKLYSDESPNSIFARFGILIAVPTDVVRKWDEFLKEYREFVALVCSCGAQTSVHASTAKQILANGNEYRCPKCSDKSFDVLDEYGRVNV
jgi:hypothetical protein